MGCDGSSLGIRFQHDLLLSTNGRDAVICPPLPPLLQRRLHESVSVCLYAGAGLQTDEDLLPTSRLTTTHLQWLLLPPGGSVAVGSSGDAGGKARLLSWPSRKAGLLVFLPGGGKVQEPRVCDVCVEVGFVGGKSDNKQWPANHWLRTCQATRRRQARRAGIASAGSGFICCGSCRRCSYPWRVVIVCSGVL